MTGEFSHHVGARATFPHELGIRTMAEREAERVEQNRLARACFARQHIETRTKLDFSRFNQNDVAQSKRAEHEVLWVAQSGRLGSGAQHRKCLPCQFAAQGREIAIPTGV